MSKQITEDQANKSPIINKPEWLDDNTWLISDTHFFHKSIIELTNRPYFHNELMVDNWRDIVKPEDHILNLGDVILSNRTDMIKIAEQLTGIKHLVLGNHDNPTRLALHMGYDILGYKMSWPERQLLFTHFPIKVPKGWLNIHGHIHGNPESKYYHTLDHIDISVEEMFYRPITLKEVLKKKGWTK